MVMVIAASNEPEKIDPAVRRSGRFDKLILIPPPDAEARRAMLEFHLDNVLVTDKQRLTLAWTTSRKTLPEASSDGPSHSGPMR
jgi:SpoVK/Ycf46/Vps4 family AAA+-type ATPase